LLLLLAPLPFLFKGLDRRMKYLAWYVLLYYTVWFLVRTYFRYITPLVPSAALIFGYVLSESRINGFVRNLLIGGILIIMLANLNLSVSVELVTMNPWAAVSGAQTEKEYLSTQRPSYPTPYYQTLDWANRNLPKDATILFLGECRSTFSDRKFVTQTVSDFNPFVTDVGTVSSPDDFAALLRKQGITHILLNLPEVKRLAGYDIVHFEPKDIPVFNGFWKKYVAEIYRDISDLSIPQQGIYSMKQQQPQWWHMYSAEPRNYVYLYEILPPEKAVQPHAVPVNYLLDKENYSTERWLKIEPAVKALRE
jgi:hypothetical protein